MRNLGYFGGLTICKPPLFTTSHSWATFWVDLQSNQLSAVSQAWCRGKFLLFTSAFQQSCVCQALEKSILYFLCALAPHVCTPGNKRKHSVLANKVGFIFISNTWKSHYSSEFNRESQVFCTSTKLLWTVHHCKVAAL